VRILQTSKVSLDVVLGAVGKNDLLIGPVGSVVGKAGLAQLVSSADADRPYPESGKRVAAGPRDSGVPEQQTIRHVAASQNHLHVLLNSLDGGLGLRPSPNGARKGPRPVAGLIKSGERGKLGLGLNNLRIPTFAEVSWRRVFLQASHDVKLNRVVIFRREADERYSYALVPLFAYDPGKHIQRGTNLRDLELQSNFLAHLCIHQGLQQHAASLIFMLRKGNCRSSTYRRPP